MAIGVIRDHHNLRRNLNLNSNYISNDGGDEAISIADDGDVTLTSNDTQLKIAYDGSNYTTMTVEDDGDLKIETTAPTYGHIALGSNGGLYFRVGNGLLYLQGNPSPTFATINMQSAGVLKLITNTNYDLLLEAQGTGNITLDAGGHVEFDNCAVGFDKLAGVFGTSQVIEGLADSTDIDFRLSNKYELELTDNLGATDFLNLIFPNTSGNFLLVISQDGTGSRLIHADSWVAYQSDGSTKATNAAFANGTDGAIRWSGGSAPTLTTTADKADIISIYWDADNQTAFAVASLNF